MKVMQRRVELLRECFEKCVMKMNALLGEKYHSPLARETAARSPPAELDLLIIRKSILRNGGFN
jgi:hypothetical protein